MCSRRRGLCVSLERGRPKKGGRACDGGAPKDAQACCPRRGSWAPCGGRTRAAGPSKTSQERMRKQLRPARDGRRRQSLEKGRPDVLRAPPRESLALPCVWAPLHAHAAAAWRSRGTNEPLGRATAPANASHEQGKAAHAKTRRAPSAPPCSPPPCLCSALKQGEHKARPKLLVTRRCSR